MSQYAQLAPPHPQAQKSLSATLTTPARTARTFMLEPVFAWITSYLLTGEGLSARGAADAALILAGILLVSPSTPCLPAPRPLARPSAVIAILGTTFPIFPKKQLR